MSRIISFTGASLVSRSLRSSGKDYAPWKLRWKPVCASTERDLSKWLKEKPFSGKDFRAVFTKRQLFGIGQKGRSWYSPAGGVWISAVMPIISNLKAPGLLGLAFAVALSESLEKKGVPVKIKWPNDLLVWDKKLAGFLPKIISRGGSVRYARIGIGLNIKNTVPFEGISLKEIMPTCNLKLDFWSAEVLFALEKASFLIGSPEFICSEAEKRLWKTELLLENSNYLWKIEGFDLDGGLRIRKDSNLQILRRWNDNL